MIVGLSIPLNETVSQTVSGCSIVVVYALWERVVRVRFPAPRRIKKNLAKLGFSFVRIVGKLLCLSIVLKLLHE